MINEHFFGKTKSNGKKCCIHIEKWGENVQNKNFSRENINKNLNNRTKHYKFIAKIKNR